MKLPWALSCAALAILLMASSHLTASTLQDQAELERELSAALATGHSVIIIGGTENFGFTLRARNRIHRPFAIQDGIGDPVMINGFQDHNYNPARDGFMNNPARGRFMLNAPVRR
ncbi:hypothetical protein DJ535_13835 [Citrobacter murliniae]|uniref:Uncharacterized protein n=1 Tax=Citrobacter murliniae TaxID=67829 RepID=A0ABY2PSX2_9ENTR|nr:MULTISPECIES: hypothetical protein [Citrobacter freundii complex]KLV66857.1 hypothetical protein SK36_01576 [Citrobacter sp. MGH106]MCQ7061197.1 hypothetical protein [Escherichia coli]THE37364.1 hypothetical protein DJ535_13835 [Citrobacter murliniae]